MGHMDYSFNFGTCLVVTLIIFRWQRSHVRYDHHTELVNTQPGLLPRVYAALEHLLRYINVTSAVRNSASDTRYSEGGCKAVHGHQQLFPTASKSLTSWSFQKRAEIHQVKCFFSGDVKIKHGGQNESKMSLTTCRVSNFQC